MEEKLNLTDQFCALSDYEIEKDGTDFESLDFSLSQSEEQMLQEILELQKDIDGKGDLMHSMLKAAEQGAMNYIDSMTDTGETFDRIKDPNKVQDTDTVEIIRKNAPADPIKAAAMKPRTKLDAHYTPFDADAEASTLGMSDEGAAKFKRYESVYAQRTKSVTAVSKEGDNIHYKKDESVNFESLSGLRSYRIGPVVPMTPVDEMVENYHTDSDNGKVNNVTGWIREHNYDTFDKELVNKFGFENKSQARKWREDNHLTIHESPDGMFLVPTDVHDAASHSGYCSKLVGLLKGGATDSQKKELYEYVKQEKVEFAKHELSIRGTRMIKGVGIAAVKDLLKCGIIVLIKETLKEFKQESKDSFIERMMRILQNSWEHVKNKCKLIISNIWKGIKGSLLSEFLTLLNDFFFKTFKNVFHLVRQMWSSIWSALKIICSKDKKYKWQERVFEATKILSAGIVGVLGFSLNEIIQKGLMSIGVPFASFISECLSGLFAGVMSAMVLMLFDQMKKNYKAKSDIVKKMLLESKIMLTEVARMEISCLITSEEIVGTYVFFDRIFSMIDQYRNSILFFQNESNLLSEKCNQELENQKERDLRTKSLIQKYTNDGNF